MKPILKLWWALLFIKLILSLFIPLSHDEAYYWVWSHHLQLSYFDHPFMVAIFFKLGHIFDGFMHAVRWPAIIIFHLSLLFWMDLLKPYLSEKKQIFWLLLIATTPFTGLGSIIVTPDLPLVFFWSWASWQFLRAVNNSKSSSFMLLGLIIGLGFSSKYHMILFVPFAVIVLYFSKMLYKLSLKTFVLGFLFFLIGAAPVLIWNYTNNFISFLFQLNHGLGRPSWKFEWTYLYILGQILLLFPTTVYLSLRKKFNTLHYNFLYFFSWLPILFFLITSFKGPVEANWPIIGYIPFLSLALINVKNLRILLINIIFFSGLTFFVVSDAIFSWTPTSLRIHKIHESNEFSLIEKQYATFQPLFAHSFQMASQLSYRLKAPIYKLPGTNRKDFYDYRSEFFPTTFKYYFVTTIGGDLPDWAIKADHQIIARHPIDQKYEILEVDRP